MILPNKNNLNPNHFPFPSLNDIENARDLIAPHVIETPVIAMAENATLHDIDLHSELWFKLECFQHTGSFKSRAVFYHLLKHDKESLAKGVVAVSGGNHAIALSYAAKKLNIPATVCVPQTIDPFRLKRCNQYGANVILEDNIHHAFETANELATHDGMVMVHPFEGPNVAIGVGTLGLEVMHQVKDIDIIVLAVGGGGLAAGVSQACKLINPDLEIYGVEPDGANTMSLSFERGEVASIEEITTIADSLGSPKALPYSFELCRQNLDAIVNISDKEMIHAMSVLAEDMNLAVEPAAAAAFAGIMGPLHHIVNHKRVLCFVCGSNIAAKRYGEFLASDFDDEF